MSSSDSDITPVFGLTKAQLQPVIHNIVPDETVVSFDIVIEHQVQGYCGYSAEKVIPTFICTKESGRVERTTVFAKRFHRTGTAEAHYYAALQEHQAPIPRMYEVLTDPDGREILFLEYLEPIGDIQACDEFMNDLDNFRQCLSATAHFNAIQPSGEYVHQFPVKDIGRGLANSIVTLEHIWDSACRGNLGDALKHLCSGSRTGLRQLQACARRLVEPVEKMRTGLIHSDIYAENTGWRRSSGELLIIDLEWIGFGPRFYDAARWLGAPDDRQLHLCQRNELARHYMEQYVRWDGSAVPLDQFMKESFMLWKAQIFSMLWFRLARALDGHVDWTEDREAGRRFFRGSLYRDLCILVRESNEN
jgi:hypothetical protein